MREKKEQTSYDLAWHITHKIVWEPVMTIKVEGKHKTESDLTLILYVKGMLRSDSSKTYIVQGKSTASPDSYLVEGQAEDVIPHIITKYQNKVKFM